MPTFFSPEVAATRLQEVIAASGVQGHLRAAGIGLIFVFCLLNLYRALLAGSGSAVVEAFLRAGIAGLLVQNSDLLAAAAVSFFRFMQAVGGQVNAQLGDWQTVATLDQLLRDLWGALWASWDQGMVDAILNLGEHVVFGLMAALTTGEQTPESEIVLAAFTMSSNVLGGSTPACLNVLVLYQTVDLFAALNATPYNLPLRVASCRQIDA